MLKRNFVIKKSYFGHPVLFKVKLFGYLVWYETMNTIIVVYTYLNLGNIGCTPEYN